MYGVKYRFIRPAVPSAERWTRYLEPAYRRRHYSNFGPVNQAFEAAMAARFGNGRAAVTASSATSGLTIALSALGVRGRVLVPSFTFAATALSVQAAGCVPVFCDCSPQSLQVPAGAVADALRSIGEISAILVVRPFGITEDLDELENLARDHGCQIVIDAAAALGSPNANGAASGLAEVFSLHATKCFAIGEGGLILAPTVLEEALRRAQNFGFVAQETVHFAVNGKMSEFHAAIGLAVLEDFGQAIRHRQKVAQRYAAVLGTSAKVSRVWPVQLSPWSTYPVLLNPDIELAAVLAEALRRGVEVRNYYRPLHRMPHFQNDIRSGSLFHTEDVASRMVCLPVYSDMTEQEQDEILDCLDGLIV